MRKLAPTRSRKEAKRKNARLTLFAVPVGETPQRNRKEVPRVDESLTKDPPRDVRRWEAAHKDTLQRNAPQGKAPRQDKPQPGAAQREVTHPLSSAHHTRICAATPNGLSRPSVLRRSSRRLVPPSRSLRNVWPTIL